MKLVIDANALFSILIKKGISSELLIHYLIELYAPEFILNEIEKYREYILDKTHRSQEELLEVLSIIKDLVRFVPQEGSDEFIQLEALLSQFVLYGSKK